MPWNDIDLDKAKRISRIKGLKPGLVKGTDIIQFTKGGRENIRPISWEEFEGLLNKKKLKVVEYNGFMKVMKAK